MFCEDCGTKNKKGTAFCENCGHKMPKEKTTKPVKDKEPMSKKTKVIIGIVISIIVVLVSLFIYLSSICKPDKIAKKYFNAYMSNDANKIYSLISVEDSDFVSKDILKQVLKDKEKVKISNYKVEEVIKEDLTTTVVIKYVVDGSANTRTKRIRLVKDKKNKYLFFDNWVVDNTELIKKEYTVNVPKDSKVTIDGKALSEKFKGDNYSSYYDKYVIPSIVVGTHNINVELESGLKLEGEMNINSYNDYTASNLKVESKAKEKLEKDMKEKFQLLYDSAIEDKDFEEIKESFDEDYRDDIEDTYDSLKYGVLNEYRKLTSIKITDVEIRSYYTVDSGIQFTVNMKYDFKGSRKDGDETKEYQKEGSSHTLYVTYLIEKDNIMKSIRNLKSNFYSY